ncbi:hypothetical protein ACQKGD_21190 [Peribacillus frigoritolerans]|uniref:hypothetical protein n=1 Tax=Peribacillus frigoritolerans TaxID=450367 RepID=UPI0007BF4389|nr:hypothetical protein [Peribacillus frigoritolerans]USK67048.1 hypothetical protein LIT26_10735 [Peribacillus frigoritolerans]
MNSEMQFSPIVYFQEKQVGNPDERIFGRPFGFGWPFFGLLAGALLSPYGYGGYGFPYGYGYGYPYGY